MARDREYYLANYDCPDLRRMLADAEDRSTRAYTMEDSLRDMYAIQEIQAALQIRNFPTP
jgi:hypothetical protein